MNKPFDGLYLSPSPGISGESNQVRWKAASWAQPRKQLSDKLATKKEQQAIRLKQDGIRS